MTAEQATALLRFAPRNTHLTELHASAKGVSDAAALALFGKDFDGEYAPNETDADSESGSGSSDNNDSSANRRAERYSRLDARFDRDVDDAQARIKNAERFTKKTAEKSSQPTAAAQLEPILKSASGYATLARGRSEVGKPFVRFERAVVVEMKAPVDRAALERLVTSEVRGRFVVSGIDPQLAWQDEGTVRYLAQTLVEQGAAYAVSGKYLVLSSSREFARDILAVVAAPPLPANRVDGAADYYAVVRVGDAKPVFDKLMNKLDGKVVSGADAAANDEGEGQEIKFFSDNLSSFITATAFREVRLRRATDGGLISERLVYSW